MKPNEIITQQFIDALKRGEVPWRKDWRVSFDFANAVSKRGYSGVNVLLLAMMGGGERYFATFNQVRQMGGTVVKGSKGIPVCFYKRLEVEDKDTGEKRFIPLLRYYTLFGMDRTEGCKWKRPEVEGQKPFEPIAEAEALIDSLNGDIMYDGGNAACFTPTTGKIHLPKRESFFGNIGFYVTLFHEIGHYLGSKENDKISTDKASKEYAREELCAEIFSCFVMNHLGLLSDCAFDNSAAYVNHWIAKLENDPSMIIWAASRANKRMLAFLGQTPETAEPATEGGE